jgi:NAD(P)-dependent dehydrogenase (short-subunit alcohol dehydrogenase family)
MDEGTIINLSSVAGLQGSATFTTYCASKGAVRLMTYALASELGPDIRVNALHPGIIETSMTTEDVPLVGGTMTDDAARQTIPSAQFGRPGDVADAAVFLASDLSGYVTGSSLPVDGGLAFASR